MYLANISLPLPDSPYRMTVLSTVATWSAYSSSFTMASLSAMIMSGVLSVACMKRMTLRTLSRSRSNFSSRVYSSSSSQL